MKTRPPAITTQSLAAGAGRRTRRAQEKLNQAERDLHSANEALAHTPHRREVAEALARNEEAERKVHEAKEELEVVKEMLDHAEPPATGSAAPPAPGKSGDGVKSLLEHLKPPRS